MDINFGTEKKQELGHLDRIQVRVTSDDIVMRDPKSGERITTAGKWVRKTPFWIRRLKAGDVVLVENNQTNSMEE